MQHSIWPEEAHLQPRLLPGIPLFANAGLPDAGFQLCEPTFAYRRLVQGRSRFLSAFSSFMRGYLDRAIKTGQCAQNIDDIGIAENDSTQLCINIRTVFKCIRKAGLKVRMAKCHFGVKHVDFL